MEKTVSFCWKYDVCERKLKIEEGLNVSKMFEIAEVYIFTIF